MTKKNIQCIDLIIRCYSSGLCWRLQWFVVGILSPSTTAWRFRLVVGCGFVHSSVIRIILDPSLLLVDFNLVKEGRSGEGLQTDVVRARPGGLGSNEGVVGRWRNGVHLLRTTLRAAVGEGLLELSKVL